MDDEQHSTGLDLARSVVDTLAAAAADIDAGRSDGAPVYQVIKDSGLLSLLVPRSAGGLGGSFTEHTKVLETLAIGNGAAALGFNMHNVAIGSLCESAGRELPGAAGRFREWVFEEVVYGKQMFASATSEAGSGAKLRGLSTTYEAVSGGYILNGKKSFVSLAGVADHYVVAARRLEAEDGDDEISHFAVSKHDQNVIFDNVYDGAALNGTETCGMTLKGVEIPRDRLFLGIEGLSLFKLVREPHWMVAGYMGAYLGIAESILRYTTEFIRRDRRRLDSPVIQAEIGGLAIELEAARALIYAAAAAVDSSKGSLEANTAIHAAKYYIGRLTPRLAVAATSICGPAAMRKSQPLERLLRESTFCAIMPAKSNECLDYVGKAVLGFNMFHSETLDW